MNYSRELSKGSGFFKLNTYGGVIYMTRFLITGGAGFIGSHLAERLISEGLGEVVILDNLSSGFENNISHIRDRVQFIKGDTRNITDVEKAASGVDYIFHEAAFVSAFDSYNRPEETNAVNIQGTYNVLEVASKLNVKRVVLASSAAIYGREPRIPNKEDMPPNPESPYAIAKICNEYHARMFSNLKGLQTVCLRYFNVFGPRQDPSSEYSGVISRFVEKYQKGENPTIFGDGKQTRDFIYVGDVAVANIKAALSTKCGHGESINIGTGKETSLLQLIEALNAATGRNITPEFKPSREGDIPRSLADVSMAKKLLDFSADTKFSDGIKQLADAIIKRT